MGKFREFLLNEEVGLADLGSRIDNMFHDQRLGNQIAGAFVSTDVSGTEQPEGSVGHPLYLPSTDMTIPSSVKSGRITTLMLKKNPIYVRLSDGTEASFTYDEYQRIEGEPALGKTMTITFQRQPEDWSRMESKIDKVIVRD
jgi:hypothetical protein